MSVLLLQNGDALLLQSGDRLALQSASSSSSPSANDPLIHHEFALDKSLAGRQGPAAVISRAGTAPYWDSNGVFQDASANVARFNHWPVTGVSRGLLVEPTREFLWHASDNVSDSYWNVAASTINADSATAPNGLGVADEIVHTGASGLIAKLGSLTVTADADHANSRFMKPGPTGGNAQWVVMIFYDNGNSANRVQAWVNVDTGAVGTVQNGGTGSGAAMRVEEARDGWRRYSLLGTPGNGATAVNFQCSIVDGDGSFTRDTSNGVLFWRASGEEGSFPTMPPQTVGSTVTRNKDDVIITALGSILDSDQGTLYSRHSTFSDDAVSRVAVDINDGGANPRYSVFINASDIHQVFSPVGSVTSAQSYVKDVVDEIVYGYETDLFNQYVNGIASTPDTSGTPGAGLNQMNIGSAYTLGVHLCGHIEAIRYYAPRRTPEEELAMSTGVFPSTVDMQHNNTSLQHNDQDLQHLRTSLRHKSTDFRHNG